MKPSHLSSNLSSFTSSLPLFFQAISQSFMIFMDLPLCFDGEVRRQSALAPLPRDSYPDCASTITS
jgi:hypothetical protein